MKTDLDILIEHSSHNPEAVRVYVQGEVGQIEVIGKIRHTIHLGLDTINQHLVDSMLNLHRKKRGSPVPYASNLAVVKAIVPVLKKARAWALSDQSEPQTYQVYRAEDHPDPNY